MIVTHTKSQLQQELAAFNARIGFVPTMGALHQGHISLVNESKKRGLRTVSSIFVNPTQFNDPKDFEYYPIDTEEDLRKLRDAGCDIAFLPTKEEIYGNDLNDPRYLHSFGALEERFEGAFRPGHFRGVGQVVHKLFEAVGPDVAFFGEKDFQQLQVIRSLVSQLELPIEIIGMPTIREVDGLAMSSRNRRLSDEDRVQSLVLHRVLQEAKQAWGSSTAGEIRTLATERINAGANARLEYFDIIDPATFEAIPSDNSYGSAHAIVAAYFGEVRLIDNMKLA